MLILLLKYFNMPVLDYLGFLWLDIPRALGKICALVRP
jgi:hypothetical protein